MDQQLWLLNVVSSDCAHGSVLIGTRGQIPRSSGVRYEENSQLRPVHVVAVVQMEEKPGVKPSDLRE